MCTQSQLDMMINRIVAFSKDLFGDKFRNVILYGSYALGDYDEESDIDILIMVDIEREELRKYRNQICNFVADLNLENDVFIVETLQSVSFFNKWKGAMPFYQNVLKEGVLYA